MVQMQEVWQVFQNRRVKLDKKTRKELDTLWANEVKKRDNYLCQWCLWEGKEKAGNQAHHIIPRSRSRALRWDIRNGITLCFVCHHRRILQYPIEYARFIQEWLQKTYNITYEDLKNLAQEALKRKL